MSRRLLTLVRVPLCALFLTPGLLAAAKDSDSERDRPTPGVRFSEPAGAQRFDAVLPGRLHSMARPRTAAGGRQLFLLVGKPPTLYRFDTMGKGALVALPHSLPEKAHTLRAIDLDGDGVDELLLGAPEALYSVGATAAPQLLISGPDIELRARPTVDGAAAQGVRLAEVGALVSYRLQPGGGLTLATSHPLPIRATRQRTGLQLSSLPVTELTLADGLRFLSGPEAHGGRRLRTLVIDPRAEAAAAPLEAWSQLPARETVDDSWYTLLDGQPALIVTALERDKVGIFERKKLRLFRLETDRSRSGLPPLFTFLTESRRWQNLEPVLTDLDGDGQQDIVVLHSKGLGGKALIADAFLRRPNGSFATKSRRTVVPVREARWHYGADLTGDGVPDLLALGEGTLHLFAGEDGAKKSKRVVAKDARWSLPLSLDEGATQVEVSLTLGSGEVEADASTPSVEGRLDVDDLDGDGRGEILLTTRNINGQGLVRVIRLR